ncbi:MAG: hypothetical protein KF862_08085 [Chitinophagaceae bacterium]|nr:hypothetical protein [Chitinophagaceae bacterium]
MLQISKYISPDIAIMHEELLAAYLSEDHHKPSVSAFEQQAILQHLDKEIHREHIYFTISLAENRIVHCNGVARWLGYADADFSLRDYLKIIHPTHAAMQGYYSMALLELLMHNELRLQFMQPVCASIIALKHATGKYIYCKRECAPFQLTEGNRMMEYLCYFHVIKEFSNESYHTRIYPGNGHDMHTGEKLLTLIRKKFSEHTNFSFQELRILQTYARQKESTSETIGEAFNIKKSTVDTFNKRILKKAEAFSRKSFSTAKEAALYFKHAGLI